MKIAFLSRYQNTIQRGAEIFVLELSTRLKKNHDVEVDIVPVLDCMHGTTNTNLIEDCDYFVRWRRWNINEVIDRFRSQLRTEEEKVLLPSKLISVSSYFLFD